MEHEQSDVDESQGKLTQLDRDIERLFSDIENVDSHQKKVEESLKTLKLKQISIWQEQQVSETQMRLSNQLVFLQDDELEGSRRGIINSHSALQNGLQTLLDELGTEKLDVERKIEDLDREVSKQSSQK